MTIAKLTARVNRRGLGLARSLALPIAILACSSDGAEATPALFAAPDALTAEHGQGPGVSLAAKVLREAGGPILFARIATGTAGQLGAYSQEGAGSAAPGTLTADGSNTATAVPALTGTPDKPYAVRIRVTTAGANIAANPAVQISLDGGLTWFAADATNVSATPTAIGSTGLLLAWTDGTFVLNNFWTAYGANSATPADATGASVLSLSGTPVDTYDVRVEVTRAATAASAGTGAVRYSLDGGLTFAPEQAVPTSRAVILGDSGVTVTFSDASLVEGDVYRFKTAAPVFTAAAMEAALLALEAVGVPDHEGIVIAGAIDATYLDELEEAQERLIAATTPRWILAHARDQGAALEGETTSQWVTALIGSTPGFAGAGTAPDFITVCAGAALVEDALSGMLLRRNVLHAIAPRIAAIDVAEHPGRVRSGPLALDTLVHDFTDATVGILDAQGFMGAQSVQGQSGSFATDRTRAATGSDFVKFMRARVMCRAMRDALSRLSEETNETVPLNPDGTIRADVADGLDNALTSYIRRQLGARVSDAAIAVDRTVDLTAGDAELPFDLSLVPVEYGSRISLTGSFNLRRSA